MNINKKESIFITDKAVSKILSFKKEKNNYKLRIFIKGGGCSGFRYGFIFDNLIGNDDILISYKNIKILIDCISYQYLIGSEVDYYDDIESSKFIIKNPNAITTCGCGSSFSI